MRPIKVAFGRVFSFLSLMASTCSTLPGNGDPVPGLFLVDRLVRIRVDGWRPQDYTARTVSCMSLTIS